MQTDNSHIDFYVELLINVYHDVVGALSSQREQRRDIEEIRKRAAHEGLSFLTKTLPRLGKSIDIALGSGTTLQFSGFKKAKGTELPAFCRTLVSVLFSNDGQPRVAPELVLSATPFEGDGQTGGDMVIPKATCESSCQRRDASTYHCRETAIKALRAIRQVTYQYYKLILPYTDAQEKKVCNDFLQAEQDISNQNFESSSNATEFQKESHSVLCIARNLIARVLCNASPMSGLPKHGPGSVATGEQPVEKHEFKRYYRRLAEKFPYDEWFFYNQSHLADELHQLQAMDELEYGTAKVVLVPKDSRGPRLISCEPLEYQWIQQSLMSVLTTTLESHPLTKGRVNFTRQDVNRELALLGSLPPFKWSTLDMKEASDRVSLKLVKALFPSEWYDALYACRTPQTRMPDGTLVSMQKFAPMGSATCFPVEALVFWALSVSALMKYTNVPLRKAASQVFVYGDDIICHTENHGVVGSTLERFDLKLNRDKCCTDGPFKESCGMDAFFGASVSPLRIRSVWSTRRKPSVLASYVAFHNAAFKRGLVLTCEYILDQIQEIWKWSVPVLANEDAGCISFVRFDSPRFSSKLRCRTRLNVELQRKEVRGYAYRPVTTMSRTVGWSLMLRVFTEQNRENPVPSPRILSTGEYPIAHRAKLRSAWTVLHS